MTITAAWYTWAILFALPFMFGVLAGQWDTMRMLRAKRRTDDASRFDAGDVITLSDGSSMRVVSTSSPNGGPADAK